MGFGVQYGWICRKCGKTTLYYPSRQGWVHHCPHCGDENLEGNGIRVLPDGTMEIVSKGIVTDVIERY